MESKTFDLIEIVRLLYKKRKFIIIFTLCALIVGVIFGLMATKQYSAKTTFIVKSPMNLDRNHIFRQGMYQNQAFFANEDEIDNIMTISKNNAFFGRLVDTFNLKDHYQVKTRKIAIEILKKRFKSKRDDTRSIEYQFSDPDSAFVATVVNKARIIAEEMFSGYFEETKQQFVTAFQSSIQKINGQLQNLDDSITQTRQQYNLYNTLLPTRGETITQQGSVSPNQSEGLEKLGTLTNLRDKLTDDRTQYLSLINEYSLESSGNAVKMFYVVEDGLTPHSSSIPNLKLIALASIFGGLIFSMFLVLLQFGFQQIKTKE